MAWTYWCKNYSTKDDAYEIGAAWQRHSTHDEPVSYGVREVPPEWELMLKLRPGSSLLPDIEDEGFRPCTEWPDE